MKRKRRVYDTRKGRGLRFNDRTGQRMGRLVALAWVGRWRERNYWRCQCDCGNIVETVFIPTSPHAQSCGCLNEESLRRKDMRVLKLDGTWDWNRAKRIYLKDGRMFQTIAQLATEVGISKSAMFHRMKTMPEERWFDPGVATGRGAKRLRRLKLKQWHATRTPLNKPQPWAAQNLKGRRGEGSQGT